MTIRPLLSLITLGVDDVAASTAFYQRLGFEMSSASVAGEVSFFKTAGGLLGLYGRAALAADSLSDPAGDGFRAVTLAVNVESRDEVDDAMASAVDAGATLRKPAQATEWGGYHGYFTDPDGHLWEIAHNPFWPFGPDGRPVLP